MTNYNFDEIIDRRNTNSLKWDYAKRRGKPEDVLPLWVADMDFRTPVEVINAIKDKASHGIFGYSEPLDSYFEALNSWTSRHYNYSVDERKVLLVPGIVFGIYQSIKALTNEGDSVLISQPVYYPFKESILDTKRNLVVSNLVNNNGHYEFDFNDFENKIIENNVKVYILCNPHNPVGRVWTRDELLKIKEITLKHNVIVISDEIHADFIYSNYKFTSYATLGEDALNNSIICISPSKTFNLAGLQNGNLYIINNEIRRGVRKSIRDAGYSQSNIMGIISTEAAYKYGDSWHKELIKYLENNLSFVRKFIKDKLPNVKLIEPEGTYLIWLDFSKLGISDNKINDIIINVAKLWLDEGNIFGEIGKYFERINIATPLSILKDALERLYNALNEEGLV